MPLLKSRYVGRLGLTTDPKDGETVYTIPHTQEQFRSESEYENIKKLYEEEIWTCKVTGRIGVSHEEAMDSEKDMLEHLEDTFPKWCEKTILQAVHHNTTRIDLLVDEAYVALQRTLQVGEPVELQVGEKEVKGSIVKIDSMEETSKPSPKNDCSSPSSDNENKNRDVNASPSKAQKITMLECKYSFKIEGQDRIIKGVPSKDIFRVYKPPSKDYIKLFIRAHSWRGGISQTSPWLVDQDMLDKYNIKNKLADVFVSHSKMIEIGKKTVEETIDTLILKKSPKPPSSPTKRPPSSQPSTPNKKQKTDTPAGTPKSKTPAGTPKSKTSKSAPNTPKSAQNSPKKRGRPKKGEEDKKNTPKKKKKRDKADESGSDSDVPLAELKKSPKKKKKDQSPSKSKSKKDVKKSKDKKKMKQLSLFEVGKKGSTTPKKGSPKKPGSPKKSSYQQPPLVCTLAKAFKKGMDCNKNAIVQHAGKCANGLNKTQIMKMPTELRDLVMPRYEKIEEKRKMEKMSPEEKEEYKKKKHQETMKKAIAIKKKKNRKYEDMHLGDLKPLPMPTLVPTPEGLPNELFGNVAMVAEFISCFKGLLLPESSVQIYTEALMKALVSGKAGSAYLGKCLSILLQTLLQDEIAQDYQELGIPVSDIPVNGYNASELVRLCLRRNDSDTGSHGSSDIEDDPEEGDEVSEAIIEQLENTDFFDLKPEEKLEVFVGLCHRIMGSYSVQDYMSDNQQKATDLWKKKMQRLKKKNDILKEQKLKQKAEKKAKENIGKENGDPTTNGDVPITKFYGDKSTENDGLTMAQRRKKTLEESKIREQEERERRNAEGEIMDLAKLEQEFEKGIMLAKLVLRQSPVGTDRHHNRYWIFHKTTPGLYVEKGWGPPEYSVKSAESDMEMSSGDESDSDESGDEQDEAARRGRKTSAHHSKIEKTAPHTGQNLWFVYTSQSDLDKLASSLHKQGYRESQLIESMNKQMDRAKKTIRDCAFSYKDSLIVDDIDVDIIDGFRAELNEIDNRLRAGGLGGVANVDQWEKELNKANTIKQFADVMKQVQTTVPEKFIKGLFAKKRRRKKKDQEEKDDEKEEEEEEEANETDKTAVGCADWYLVGVENWLEAVDNCPTWSRLHMLLAVLDSCVKWDKSAENAKCRICRKKGDESAVLLCDECNQAFHMSCLRPALWSVPQGEWFCPACVPSDRKRRARATNFKQLAGEDDDDFESDSDSDGSSEAPERDTTCAVCGGESEEMAECSTCPCVYHYDCHEPRLRHPRATWRCCQCTSGVRIRKQSRRHTARKAVAKIHNICNGQESTDDTKVIYGNRMLSVDAIETDLTQRCGCWETCNERLDVVTVSTWRHKFSNLRSNKFNKLLELYNETIQESGHKNKGSHIVDGLEICRKAWYLILMGISSTMYNKLQNAASGGGDEEPVEQTTSDSRRSSGRSERLREKRSRYMSESSESDEEPQPPAKRARTSRTSQRTVTENVRTGRTSRTSRGAAGDYHGYINGKDDEDSSEYEEADSEDGEEEEGESSSEQSASDAEDKQAEVKKQPVKRKPKKEVVQEDPQIAEIKHLDEVVGRLRRHRSAWPFQDPVDKKVVPDYHQIVKNPIDLLTIKHKVINGGYTTSQLFVDDIALLFNNCNLYNTPDSEVGKCVGPLEKSFRDACYKLLPSCTYSRDQRVPKEQTTHPQNTEQARKTMIDDHSYV